MATIKSFTDLSQSKVLAGILPHESADMTYRPIMDKSYFIDCVTDKLNRIGIQNLKDMTIEDISSIAEEFFGMIEVQGHVFCGIEGYLQYVYGCMLERWFKEYKKHEGKRCSEVPELISMQKDIDDFLAYTRKFLEFECIDGEFKKIKI